jgi:pantetheine-phosphate adenylyltransferase
MKYSHVFVAGTFDRLHKGHEAVLFAAFSGGDYVTVGLTSDLFIQTYKSAQKEAIRQYEQRKAELDSWLETHGFTERSTVVAIDDPYEPAVSSSEIDALVVTLDNKARGEEINARRIKPLAFIEVALVPAEDGLPISSTRMRSREIDGSGTLIMPEKLRVLLSQPLGQVWVTDKEMSVSIAGQSGKIIITVGDASTEQLLHHSVVPHIAIIDLKIARVAHNTLASFPSGTQLHTLTVASGPGFISAKAVEIVKQAMEMAQKQPHQSVVVVVEGEEDLLVLPAVLYAKEGSVLYYGQPHMQISHTHQSQEGLVEVDIDKDKKSYIASLFSEFTKE